MNEPFRLDGVEHDPQALASGARALAARLVFVQQRLQELHNQQALLRKTRNAYIADLKAELLRPPATTYAAAHGGPGAGWLGAFLHDDADTF